MDLVQLIHETIQRSNNNGLVCALKYPIAVEPDEDDKDSGRSCTYYGISIFYRFIMELRIF